MKKIKYLFVLIALSLLFLPSVYAVNITGCNQVLGTNVLIDVKIANLVHLIIVVIKIAVPVILVVFGMMDLVKGLIAQKDDEIKKGQQTFIKRLITAALVFFLISIVQLVIGFVAGNDSEGRGIMNCANCFINGADATTGICKGSSDDVADESDESNDSDDSTEEESQAGEGA